MILIRSLLFIPAIQQRFIERGPNAGADALCLDMEDSVPADEKQRARDALKETVPNIPRTGYLLFVRVNGLDTGLLEEDLTSVVWPGLDGISLPKAVSADYVKRVDSYLTLLEKQRGMQAGQVKLIPWIESAIGVYKALEICTSSPRLLGVSFGAEDFTIDMGVQRTAGGAEVAWAKSAVAVACRAAGLQPIDTPTMDFRDMLRLESDSLHSKSLGYRGKYCIHPDQVPVVNRLFAPSDDDITAAKRIIEVYEEAEGRGVGAVGMDGQVVDWPIYVRARQLLEWAEATTSNQNNTRE